MKIEFVPITILVDSALPHIPESDGNYYKPKKTTPAHLLDALRSPEMQAYLQANPADAAKVIEAAGGDSGFQQSLANIPEPK